MNGKKICEVLRGIRQDIASANDIEYAPAVCNHKGDCSGTCPRCESEMRYIERQLRLRRAMGKAAVVAGLTLSTATLTPALAQTQQSPPQVATQRTEPRLVDAAPGDSDVVIVRGNVIDKQDKEPLIGASIVVIGTKYATTTDVDGAFAFIVKRDSRLQIEIIGMETLEIDAKQNISGTFVMDYALKTMLTGEVLIVEQMHAVDADIYQPNHN